MAEKDIVEHPLGAEYEGEPTRKRAKRFLVDEIPCTVEVAVRAEGDEAAHRLLVRTVGHNHIPLSIEATEENLDFLNRRPHETEISLRNVSINQPNVVFYTCTNTLVTKYWCQSKCQWLRKMSKAIPENASEDVISAMAAKLQEFYNRNHSSPPSPPSDE